MTDRRMILRGMAGLAALSVLPIRAAATPEMVAAAIADAFGTNDIPPGPITLTVPPLAESGNAVPITAQADSPMTADDRILRLALFSESNPRPKLVEVRFGPAAAQAIVTTNIRLNGTQTVTCIAETADGRLFRADQIVRVVVGACTTLELRF